MSGAIPGKGSPLGDLLACVERDGCSPSRVLANLEGTIVRSVTMVQDGLQLANELVRGGRFGDIGVGAGLKRAVLVSSGASRGKDNDRHATPAA